MTGERSQDEARAEFAAYVRSATAPPSPPQPEFDPGSPEATAAGALAQLFDFRIALVALGVLVFIFAGATQMDAQRYRAILDEHRYSTGESINFLWRYDGLDVHMRDPKRHLNFWDRERLRHNGLHVTYSEAKTHGMLRTVRMTSALLIVLGLVVAVWSAWKWFESAEQDYVPDVELTAGARSGARPSPGRTGFGRRAD